MENKDIVRIARAILGMKQKQLARQLEISKATISKWESGASDVPEARLEYFRGIIINFIMDMLELNKVDIDKQDMYNMIIDDGGRYESNN